MRTDRDVPTPWLCRKTMISRMAFCSLQPAVMRPRRVLPMPSTSSSRCWRALDDVEDGLAERCDQPAGKVRAQCP